MEPPNSRQTQKAAQPRPKSEAFCRLKRTGSKAARRRRQKKHGCQAFTEGRRGLTAVLQSVCATPKQARPQPRAAKDAGGCRRPLRSESRSQPAPRKGRIGDKSGGDQRAAPPPQRRFISLCEDAAFSRAASTGAAKTPPVKGGGRRMRLSTGFRTRNGERKKRSVPEGTLLCRPWKRLRVPDVHRRGDRLRLIKIAYRGVGCQEGIAAF